MGGRGRDGGGNGRHGLIYAYVGFGQEMRDEKSTGASICRRMIWRQLLLLLLKLLLLKLLLNDGRV